MNRRENQMVENFVSRAKERKWCVLPEADFPEWEKRCVSFGRALQKNHAVLCVWPHPGRAPLRLCIGNFLLCLRTPAPAGGFRQAIHHIGRALPRFESNLSIRENAPSFFILTAYIAFVTFTIWAEVVK